jgi:hypothetical protein
LRPIRGAQSSARRVVRFSSNLVALINLIAPGDQAEIDSVPPATRRHARNRALVEAPCSSCRSSDPSRRDRHAVLVPTQAPDRRCLRDSRSRQRRPAAWRSPVTRRRVLGHRARAAEFCPHQVRRPARRSCANATATTRQPVAAKWRAMAAPKPAPVTKTVCGLLSVIEGPWDLGRSGSA